MDPTPVLSVDGVTKRYGENVVLDGITFSLAAGERTALLGENGAGKSTLAKIIAGSTRPDDGGIAVDGRGVRFTVPRDALAAGVSFIPQELVYVPALTVAENISLGAPPSRFGFTSPSAMIRAARKYADIAGFDLPLDTPMADISLAQRQLVEIAKAVTRQARILILDEPTAALESEDSARLHELLGRLSASGVAVILISHRLEEVFATCDTVHVLRNGALVRSSRTADLTPSQAIADMLGHEQSSTAKVDRRSSDAPPRLEVRGLRRTQAPILDDVDLVVREGEIVGLYGLRGSGADTLAETLGGLHPDAVGRIAVAGATMDRLRNPRQSWRAGIAYVPADRKSQGLVLIDSIRRNFTLPDLRRVSRAGWILRRRERAVAQNLYTRVRVRARSIDQTVGELSGGNQQKVLVGNRLLADAPVLVLHEPSRGVDVGAREEIHDILRGLADGGTAQLVVTSDIEEAVLLCDRLLIVHRGRIVDDIAFPTRADQARALEAAGGIQ